MEITAILKTLKQKESSVGICALLAAALLLGFFVFCYADLTNTVDNANTFIDAVRENRIEEFYEISIERASTEWSANYSCSVYILFALWQLPFYALSKIVGRSYLSWASAMLWSKTLVVLFASGVAVYIYKTVLLCTEDKYRSSLAVYLYCSSAMLFHPVMICGQLDVIALFFISAGIFFYLKDDIKRFFIFFSLAMPFKMFALFLALPLLLIRNKHIIKAAFVSAAMMWFIWLENFLFRDSPAHHYALLSQNRAAINQIMESHLELAIPVSIFILIYVLICVYAYTVSTVERESIIYICLLCFGSFLIFGAVRSYWIAYIAPFMAMCICTSDRYQKTAVIADSASGISYILYYAAAGKHDAFTDTLLASRLFLRHIIPLPDERHMKYGSLNALFTEMKLDRYAFLFSSVFAAGVITVLILTVPWINRVVDKRIPKEVQPKPGIGIFLLRPALLILLSVLLIYARAARTNPVAIDTRTFSKAESGISITDAGKNVVTQRIRFPDDRALDQMVLSFGNSRVSRQNLSMMKLEIFDTADNECVFSYTAGACVIKNLEDLMIDLRHTQVFAGKDYEIRLSGTQGIPEFWEQESLEPVFCVTEGNNDLKYISGSVCVNDEPVKNRVLYLMIR